MVTTVTGKRQVTIPAELAAAANIEKGSQFDWALAKNGREIRLRILPSRRQLLDSVRGAGRKYLKPGESFVADLIEERARDEEDAERDAGVLL